MTGWALSVDIGTTATAAALEHAEERRVVELDGRSRMPSTVLLDERGGLVVGEAAEHQAAMHPERVERTPKARLGDEVVLLGEAGVDPVDMVAAILRHVARTATDLVGGQAPTELVLTHPARWGSARVGRLVDAAERAGLPAPVLVPEPVAAAAQVAAAVVPAGSLLAVYDLGGGTFDAAVVRRTATGFEVAGPPGGDAEAGGEALDELVLGALLAQLDPALAQQLRTDGGRTWRQARFQARQSARQAKEALSTTESFRGYLGAPLDVEWTLDGPQLESLVLPTLTATVAALLDTVRRAGVGPADLHTVVMAGGGSRMPLVGRLLEQGLGRPPTTWGDPKATVSLGALAARAGATAPAAPSAPPPAPAPPAPSPPAPEPAPSVDVAPGLSAVADPPRTGSPLEPDPGPGGWDRRQVGLFVALACVALGLLCLALLAALG